MAMHVAAGSGLGLTERNTPPCPSKHPSSFIALTKNSHSYLPERYQHLTQSTFWRKAQLDIYKKLDNQSLNGHHLVQRSLFALIFILILNLHLNINHDT